MTTYAAAEVDAIQNDLLALLEQSLTLNKVAAADQAEVAVLRAKLAAVPKVVLQKVATTQAVLDEAILGETLDVLVDAAYILPANREKMAATLRNDPNAVLRLTSRVATLSTPSHEDGRGVKSASITAPAVFDEWEKVVTEGA